MRATIEDLTPFFQDRCWMFVLLARQANVGVILRRGPSDWWHVTRWDTERDRFESGQWFRGRLFPEKCDLAPDGKLFLYCAGKYRPRDLQTGYHFTWTAVSRPPFLSALALWPIGDTYGGRGVFYDAQTVVIATSAPSFGARHHPDHPPGPLRVFEYCQLKRGDPLRDAAPCWKSRWRSALGDRGTELRKPSGDFTLGREVPPDYFRPSRRRTLYTLYRADGEPVALFEAHWTDWDRRGRLVATAGGRVLAAKPTKQDRLKWQELAAMHGDQPARVVAPDWARRWE